jgi:hypothetical protein
MQVFHFSRSDYHCCQLPSCPAFVVTCSRPEIDKISEWYSHDYVETLILLLEIAPFSLSFSLLSCKAMKLLSNKPYFDQMKVEWAMMLGP